MKNAVFPSGFFLHNFFLHNKLLLALFPILSFALCAVFTPHYAAAAVPFSMFFDKSSADKSSENISSTDNSSSENSADNLPSLAPLLKKVTPAVVNISTKTKVRVAANPLMDDPIFRQFFQFQFPNMPKAEREVQSVGSGVIVDAEKGYVITNNHVVKEADEIYVNLKDKRRIKAQLLGRDEETDIAVLKIKADNLTSLKIGDSGKLQVGDFVIAIGNPFGIGQTVTSGIVSALDRNGLGIEGYENFIQTDAAINPGNSGGALINLRGELVGINTAILSRSGGNVGIGFAIPVAMAGEIMQQLVSKGSIERGRLGVHIQDITPEIAEAMEIKIDEGALVAQVEQGSSAEKSGLKEGDIVVSLNGSAVRGASDLRNRIGMLHVGDQIKMEVLRQGGMRDTLTAVIGKRGNGENAAAADKSGKVFELKGATLGAVELNSRSADNKRGVQIVAVDPESQAAAAGLRPGDIIISVNRQPVSTPKEAVRAAENNKKSLLLNVLRGNSAIFVVIK